MTRIDSIDLKLSQKLIEASKLSNLLDDNDFEIQFQQIASVLGESLEVEYCNIGLFKDGVLEDCGVWTYYNRSSLVNNFLNTTKKRTQSETLVGSAIQTITKDPKSNYFYWDYNEKGEFTNEHLTGYFSKVDKNILDRYRKEVLKSGGFFSFLVFRIHNDKNDLLGYLHIVNKIQNGEVVPFKSFEEEEIMIVNKFIKNIAVLLENLKFHYLSNLDEKTINGFYEINNIDALLLKILKYLNIQFNSLIGAYLMLAKNGFENENEPMVVLRAVEFLNEKIKKKYETKIQQKSEAKIENSLSGQIIMDTLRLSESDKQESIKFIDFRTQAISIMWDFIEETSYVIGIPIMKSSPFEKSNPQRPQEKIWGVICLQPLNNQENEITRTRLTKIAKHIQVLLEKIIYERRYHQIEQLNSKLSDLDSYKDKTNINYNEIVKIVKDVSRVEACSIFFLSDNKEFLYLKATTVQEAYRHINLEKELLNIDELIKNRKKIYEIYDEKKSGITGRSVLFKEPVIVYDIDQNPYTYKIFVEITKTEHKSIVVIPLKNESGEYFGALRCINKVKEGFLLPFFVESDLELIKLISGITMSFMLNYEFHERRQNAMIQFAHESRIPMQAIEDDKAVLEFQLKKYISVMPQGIQETLDILTKNVALLMNNVLNSENLFLENTEVVKMEFKKTSLHNLIKRLNKLFISKIISNTADAPDLYVDEKQIYQVFYNLILNAQRYSNKGSSIKIFYELSKIHPTIGYHQFKIQNEGIGINEGEEEMIFQPYYRSEEARKKYQTGTGIGLKVCRDIMNNHSGLIKVTRNNHPTEFSIFFPHSLNFQKIEK